MRGLAILAALVALPVWAAEPATSMSSAGMGAQLSKLLLGLLLVIGLIFLWPGCCAVYSSSIRVAPR